MASASADSVTIDRSYFETLVRRAEFNTDTFTLTSHAVNTIAISQAELDSLRLIVGKYENLRRNLLRGGVGEDVVELLSQDDASIQGGNILPSVTGSQADQDGGALLHLPGTSPAYGSGMLPSYRHNSVHANGGGNRNQANPSWVDASLEAEDASCDGGAPPDESSGANYADPQNRRPHFERQCTRTVLLTNLAEGTTHADITGAVRGGILLDIFLRSHDRSAQVSFLSSADSRSFFDHVRKHDLYIKNKRVDIRWSDRQFILPGHVAAKIGSGATRNLVIRQIDSRHTEQSIRDDLDHIHNLVVIRVEFAGGNCFIKTNSVHNALFARMCMMSRLAFKGTKIEWDLDECAQPFAKIPQAKPRRFTPPAKKNSTTMPNRFHLLNLDGEDEDEVSTVFPSKTSVGITA